MLASKNKLVILIGPTYSGWLFFAKYLINKKYTLGIDFINNKKYVDINYKYTEKINNDFCYTYFTQDGIKYGLSRSAVYESDFIIRNPISIKYTLDYLKEIKRKYVIVYFDIHKDIRINKLLKIFSFKEVKNTLEKEKEMYEKFKFKASITVTNDKFKPDILLNIIEELKKI